MALTLLTNLTTLTQIHQFLITFNIVSILSAILICSLKKWSWLLMKDDINLDNERIYNHRFGTELNRRDIRDMIFETFPILHDAYELKELYRKFNQISYYDEAVKLFPRLQQYFAESGISEYYEFSGILSHWKDEILNSFMRPFGNR